MDEKIQKEIRGLALQNAAEHGGQTQAGIVLSKLLGTRPDLRPSAKQIIPDVSSIVSEINGLSVEQQRAELENFSALPAKPEPAREQALPDLEGAEHGHVVTRFPPEPNGYPHIGHAKAAVINEAYADMYGGKKILRMDDTNPESERLEYYAAIKVGLDWLGIQYDKIKNTSDDMDLLLERGNEIIKLNGAYICTCKRDAVSKNRRNMMSCKCSMADSEKNADRWEKMFAKFKPGEAAMRFRGDMRSENTVMRDPVLFRIIDAKHPLLGDKYRVWPSYDFAVAIEDSIDGVTHAFRSKEYELRNELYYSILDRLNMRKPRMLEFSRLEFKGMPVSKRVLRPLIDSGQISWYDDPRLPTLEALKRRGIVPDAVRRFVMSLGFTKADTLAPFDALEAFNRKKIDPDCIRLFLVREPKKITVNNLPSRSVEISNHPAGLMGSRTVELDSEIYVPYNDVKNLNKNDHIRLMGLGNIKIDETSPGLVGTYVGDDKVDCPKMQWLPQKHARELRVLVPGPLFIDDSFNENSLEELDVLTEPHYLQVSDEHIIQFVRFGYCRKESQNMAVYAHR